jgi:hypothetical protein
VTQDFELTVWKLSLENLFTKFTRDVERLVPIDQYTVHGMDSFGFAHRHVKPGFTPGKVPIDQGQLGLDREYERKSSLVYCFRNRLTKFFVFAAERIGVPFRHLAYTGQKGRPDEQH